MCSYPLRGEVGTEGPSLATSRVLRNYSTPVPPFELVSWHARERRWAASVEIRVGDAVAWGLGSGSTQDEARVMAREHALALLDLGIVSPRGSFEGWLVHASARGLLAPHHADALLNGSPEIEPTLTRIEILCKVSGPAWAPLRVEGAQLRARFRAALRARTANARKACPP
jgi:hypothetical protein